MKKYKKSGARLLVFALSVTMMFTASASTVFAAEASPVNKETAAGDMSSAPEESPKEESQKIPESMEQPQESTPVESTQETETKEPGKENASEESAQETETKEPGKESAPEESAQETETKEPGKESAPEETTQETETKEPEKESTPEETTQETETKEPEKESTPEESTQETEAMDSLELKSPEVLASPLRTSSLNLVNISPSNTMGAVFENGIYTNGAEKWSYDTNGSGPILTLNGFEMVNSNEADYGVTLPDGAQIVLIGENSITSKSLGIYGNGGLVVSGNGTLTINVQANTIGESSAAIQLGNGTTSALTVTDAVLNLNNLNTQKRAPSALDNQQGQLALNGATVTAMGFSSAINCPGGEITLTNTTVTIDQSTRGINCGEGSVIIEDSIVNVTCTKDQDREEMLPVAISGASVAINGSTVTASSNGDCAIFTPGTLSIDGESYVTASGFYAGLQSNGNMAIDGTANSSSSDDSGIYTKGTLTIGADAVVTAVGNKWCGINAAGDITINGTVNASSPKDAGIFTPGNLTIGSNAEVTSSSNKAALKANTNVTISGGIVNAVSTADVGIYTNGTLAISGAATEVRATGALGALSKKPVLSDGIEATGGIWESTNTQVTYAIHTHTAVTEWSKDASGHWHECTAGDGEKMDSDTHTFGEWTVDIEATETTPGSKHRDCSVCEYTETVEIPSAADDTWAYYPASDYNGGDGSVSNPYRIANGEQLAFLAVNVNKGNSYANQYFQLEENIDLSEHRWVPIGIYKWETNGNTINNAFSGSFDGNNKTISGLMVDERKDKYCAGLFGYISDSAVNGVEPVIKDLTISNAVIYHSESGLEEAYSGILAGKAMVNDGARITISNIVVSGTITNEMTDGNYHSGGMIGEAVRVDFSDCKAENISISGATNTGGFVGTDSDSTFTKCHADGKVSGGWTMGGFVGYSTSSSIVDPSTSSYSRCSADVEVTGTDWRLGGFVGFLEGGKITNSVAYGNVTSLVTEWEPRAGGFAGENSGTIEYSYAEGVTTNAHPTIKAGGFMGYDAGGTTNKCMFDKTLNSALGAISTVGTAGTNDIKEGTTQENKTGICADILDGHDIDSTEWNSDETEHWNTCKDCGGKFDTASHTYGAWVTDTEATETNEGSEHRDCTVCGHSETRKIPVIPHNHTLSEEWSKNASEHWHECTADDGYKEDIAAHTYGQWVIDKEADETAAGSRHRDCNVCGQRETQEIPVIPHNHTLSEEWSKNASEHWHECTAGDGYKEDLAAHTYGRWVIDKEAAETEAGSRHRDCSVCGQREIQEIPAKGEGPVKPAITAGGGSEHLINNGTDLTITCSGALEDFQGVYVDDQLVDQSNYTLKSGSTIVIFKSGYLDTLPVGSHTVRFQYKDALAAETTFIVAAKAAADPSPEEKPEPAPSTSEMPAILSPKTGDTTNLLLYAMLLILSAGGLVSAAIARKRNQ